MLGADICYSIKALPFIFQSIKTLLKKGTDSRGLLGYVSRLVTIRRHVHLLAFVQESMYICSAVSSSNLAFRMVDVAHEDSQQVEIKFFAFSFQESPFLKSNP